MIKAQLKPNIDPTFLLSLKEKLLVKEREEFGLEVGQSWV
jgi:hypothetical protein